MVRLSGLELGTHKLCVPEYQSGTEKLLLVEGIYLGIKVQELTAEAKSCLREDHGKFPRIELHFTNQ